MIRIRGRIGELDVDLTIEGLPPSLAETPLPEANSPKTAAEDYISRLMEYLQQHTSLAASEIINWLNQQGLTDKDIKKALVSLRHHPSVTTKTHENQQELVYQYETKD